MSNETNSAGGAAPLGILCAIPQEIEHLAETLDLAETTEVAGYTFRRGRLDSVDVVLVETGIGKVGAAMVATLLCYRFGCRALLFSGVAGGLDPQRAVGDVVVGTSLIQHDYGAMIEERIKAYRPGVPPLPGFEGPLDFAADPDLVARARDALAGVLLPPLSAAATGEQRRVPEIVFGTILTGDTFVNCEDTRRRLHLEFEGLAVEMEGSAVAQVAERFEVPLLVVRALSDLAGAESHMDFHAFLNETATNAALLIRRLVPIV